ncbi:MAG: hypothetical protein AOA65_0963 [Candidatus Bathyarchaeota archaeon BA1]|nr:MAG: hypothetical protein AOA65_0963 [Candidatus Bathyarchaeota archaeon BA1]
MGVALDGEVLGKIDAIIEASEYLEVSRSEVVGGILAAFFKSPSATWRRPEGLVIDGGGDCSKNKGARA